MKNRCDWCKNIPDFYQGYHDKEWGVPQHDDKMLFEMLILEGAQAGLSWECILKKREGYRDSFKRFSAKQVSLMTDDELNELMRNKKIVRNRLKIFSVRTNALVFLQIQKEFGSFDKYLWSFTKNEVIQSRLKSYREVASPNKEAQALSKDLKGRGMAFVGPVIIYAYMEAIGMINNHVVSCFRYKELSN